MSYDFHIETFENHIKILNIASNLFQKHCHYHGKLIAMYINSASPILLERVIFKNCCNWTIFNFD